MQCFGHVINLVVKEFLWGQNANSGIPELGAFNDDVNGTKQQQLWWKQGPIGHLHTICTESLHSHWQSDGVSEKSKQMIPNTNGYIASIGSITRLNGNVDSIERDFIVCASLDKFVFITIWDNQHKKKCKSQHISREEILNLDHIITNESSEDDWENLRGIYDVLQQFKVWSLHLLGLTSLKNSPNAFGANVIPAFDEF